MDTNSHIAVIASEEEARARSHEHRQEFEKNLQNIGGHHMITEEVMDEWWPLTKDNPQHAEGSVYRDISVLNRREE